MSVFLYVVFCMCFYHFGDTNRCGDTKTRNGTLGKALVLYKLQIKPDYEKLYLRSTNYTSKKMLLEHNLKTKENHQNNSHSRYQFDTKDSSVVIQTLQKEDESDYELTFQKTDRYEDICLFEVKVYEQISNLTVSVTEDSQNNTCRVTMTCLMHTGTNVTFSWMRDDKLLSHDGSTLEISITNENANSTFRCTAKNTVSQESSKHKLSSACNADQGTSYYGLILYILVPTMIGVIIVIVVGILITKKCNRGMSSKQYNYPQRCPQSRPPAPEPVSEQTHEITHTLYSTVQKPENRSAYAVASNNQPFSSVYELAGPCRDDAQSQNISNEETRV